MNSSRGILSSALRSASICTAAILLVIYGCNREVESQSNDFIHNEIATLPQARVALVLGCNPRVAGGRLNLYFVRRIEAAAAVYHSGRCDYLLVSGDHGTAHYNEPEEMKRALIAKGVPAERIVADYAGFRTLDSVVRAKQVFGQSRIIVVSQAFHNQRAIYIARSRGLEAFGFNANDVNFRGGIRTHIREKIARVKTLFDMRVANTAPRFLGPMEPIPGANDQLL
ncbi:MAG: ElyC/SanA/YdcF family protein [Verrucomicrobiota bacterium]